jgi:hypothetical protein
MMFEFTICEEFELTKKPFYVINYKYSFVQSLPLSVGRRGSGSYFRIIITEMVEAILS